MSRFGSLVTLTQDQRDGCQKIFYHTHMSTMCDLKKFASGGFPGKLKRVGRMTVAEMAERDQKQ